MNLNEIAKVSYETAKKRQENGANISVKTRDMLKHCATEVVEAMEAYQKYICAPCAPYFEEGSSIQDLNRIEGRKNNFASELADIICCAAIIAHAEGIDLDKAVADCLEKNKKRAEGTGDKL